MAGQRAPGDLVLVQDFVNTYDWEEATDAIDTPEALGTWLADRGLAPPASAGAADHRLAIELREALHRLVGANSGGHVGDRDIAVLNRVARDSGLRPLFTTGAGVRLEPVAAGVTGALGRLLGLVSAAMADGSWGRLKACADQGCQWVFYDRSRNHSGHWCSMEVCGNRAKARQFRLRRRAGS